MDHASFFSEATLIEIVKGLNPGVISKVG